MTTDPYLFLCSRCVWCVCVSSIVYRPANDDDDGRWMICPFVRASFARSHSSVVLHKRIDAKKKRRNDNENMLSVYRRINWMDSCCYTKLHRSGHTQSIQSSKTCLNDYYYYSYIYIDMYQFLVVISFSLSNLDDSASINAFALPFSYGRSVGY